LSGETGSPSDGSITEALGNGLRLRVSPGAFFQTSTEGAELLFGAILDACTASYDGIEGEASGPVFPSLLIDVCCGGGAIGLYIATAARAAARRASATASAVAGTTTATSGGGDGDGACRVVGVELCEAAVADAKHNASLNGLDSGMWYSAHCGKAEEVLQSLLGEAIADAAATAEAPAPASPAPSSTRQLPGQLPGRVCAVVDPPRTGLHPSVCRALRATAAVDRLVFVSCNPRGQAMRHDFVLKGGSLQANARVLCDKRGKGRPFRLVGAAPVDMFPHTPHVELVVVFER
jgi:tRNA/tmRNA/rRNA uracil-C5-methylase (TrmA/RlmC/RlmD family)